MEKLTSASDAVPTFIAVSHVKGCCIALAVANSYAPVASPKMLPRARLAKNVLGGLRYDNYSR